MITSKILVITPILTTLKSKVNSFKNRLLSDSVMPTTIFVLKLPEIYSRSPPENKIELIQISAYLMAQNINLMFHKLSLDENRL